MIGDRLAEVRKEAGLTLREFAARLERDAGYSVAHSTLSKYERRKSVPSDFALAVSEAFGVDPRWLLAGDRNLNLDRRREIGLRETLDEIRRRLDGIEVTRQEEMASVKDLEEAWKRFQRRLDPAHRLRSVILGSWKRSREAGVDGTPSESEPRRLSDEELAERLDSSACLVRTARPHLRWLSEVIAPTPHVAYLTDADGIVLWATGAEPEELEAQGLAPGFDWSEDSMGTNGVGTALVTGRPTVVLGPEHYIRDYHEFVCTAVPIRDPEGKIIGGADLSTLIRHGHPGRLGIVAYVAEAVENDLRRDEQPELADVG